MMESGHRCSKIYQGYTYIQFQSLFYRIEHFGRSRVRVRPREIRCFNPCSIGLSILAPAG